MRVISGKHKGIVIDGFDIDGTRPTMDRVKESMFAMIQLKVKDSVVLDLFSGSGSLGIEAISNYSDKVYFVDNNKIAIDTITKNIKKLNTNTDYEIIKSDYLQALSSFKNKVKFDLVFLDPPYKLNFINEILDLLLEYDLLNDEAYIVCEFDKEDIDSKKLELIKNKKYGNKYVKVYKK